MSDSPAPSINNDRLLRAAAGIATDASAPTPGNELTDPIDPGGSGSANPGIQVLISPAARRLGTFASPDPAGHILQPSRARQISKMIGPNLQSVIRCTLLPFRQVVVGFLKDVSFFAKYSHLVTFC